MLANVVVVLLALPQLASCSLADSSSDFPNALSLDPQENYKIFWKYDDTTITFEVKVKTQGYVGFGVSPNGGMAGSDMVIGWVQDDEVIFKVSI